MGLTKNNDIITLAQQLEELTEVVEQLKATVYKEDILAIPDTNWDVVRAKRDILLKNSDWTMTPGATVDQRSWSAYRQVLRDLPQTYGPHNLHKLKWPEPPGLAGPNTNPVE